MSFDYHDEISASEAARLLDVSHAHVAQLMRDGAIAARQLPSGDWLTTRALLDAYRDTARRGRGRRMAPSVAWGVLWELSGLRAHWLSKGTLSRVRRDLAVWSANDIVRAVSSRRRAVRYATVPESALQVDVIRSGRSVAGVLRVGLGNKPSIVVGYPRVGDVADLEARYGLRPSYRGEHVLFENTLPVEYEGASMPEGVVAADLAASIDFYERKRGREALDRLWDEWAAHYGSLFVSRTAQPRRQG